MKRDDLIVLKYLLMSILMFAIFLVKGLFYNNFNWWILVTAVFFDLIAYLKADK